MAEYVTQFDLNGRIVKVKDDELNAAVYPFIEEETKNRAFVTPEMYGAVGDGLADDSAAFQAAITDNNVIVCKQGHNYYINNTLRINHSKLVIDLNGATISAGYDGRHLFYNFNTDDSFTGYGGNGDIVLRNGTIRYGGISFIHAENVLFENMHFEDCIRDHYLEICACKNFKIDKCSFIGMHSGNGTLEYINIDPCYYINFPWVPQSSVMLDGTPNNGIVITNCEFALGEGDYAYGQDAIGVHDQGDANAVNHTNISIINNRFKGFTTYTLRLNCMDNVTVTGNRIYSPIIAFEIGAWVPCVDMSITNNDVLCDRPNSQAFMAAFKAGGVTRLRMYANSYGATASNHRIAKYDASALTANTPFNLVRFDCNPALPTNIEIPVTSFNHMTLQIGSVSTGTYYESNVSAYFERRFQVGESYAYNYVDSNHALQTGTVTITAAKTLTFSGFTPSGIIFSMVPLVAH